MDGAALLDAHGGDEWEVRAWRRASGGGRASERGGAGGRARR